MNMFGVKGPRKPLIVDARLTMNRGGGHGPSMVSSGPDRFPSFFLDPS